MPTAPLPGGVAMAAIESSKDGKLTLSSLARDFRGVIEAFKEVAGLGWYLVPRAAAPPSPA